jgi:hypothetical protein
MILGKNGRWPIATRSTKPVARECVNANDSRTARDLTSLYNEKDVAVTEGAQHQRAQKALPPSQFAIPGGGRCSAVL